MVVRQAATSAGPRGRCRHAAPAGRRWPAAPTGHDHSAWPRRCWLRPPRLAPSSLVAARAIWSPLSPFGVVARLPMVTAAPPLLARRATATAAGHRLAGPAARLPLVLGE
jgi:hypothetical protein